MAKRQRVDDATAPAEVCMAAKTRRASRALSRYYDNALRPSGLRATQFTLLTGIRIHGSVTLGALAERLGLDRTTLNRNLSPLQRDGLVASSEGDDQRTRELRLTAKGQTRLARALPLWRAAQTAVDDQLGAARAKRMRKDLRELSLFLEQAVED